MHVRDVMTADVASVRIDATFHEVVQVLLDRNLSGLPVVDAVGRVVGVVTENDLLAKEAYPPRQAGHSFGRAILEWVGGQNPVAAKKATALRTADLMSQPPITIAPDASLHEAARRMIERNVKRLPVVKDGMLVGVVSRHDIVRVYARPDTTLAAEIEEMLFRSAYTPSDTQIRIRVEQGIAIVEGRVPYQSDVRIISNLVAAVDGVIRVDNRLAFDDPDPSIKTLRTDPQKGITL